MRRCATLAMIAVFVVVGGACSSSATKVTSKGSAVTSIRAHASTGGRLQGTYALVYGDPSCTPTTETSNRMYVAGDTLTIPSSVGPALGTLKGTGTTYTGSIYQSSNLVASEVTFVVTSGGDAFTATGQVKMDSGGGAKYPPCAMAFSGHRISTSASIPISTSTTIVPPTSASTTSIAAPTTTSSTPTTASAAGRCTLAAIQAGLEPGHSTTNPPQCVGAFALAFGTDAEGDDFTALLHWNGAAWAEVDKATECASGVVPAPLLALGCQSG